MNASPEAERDAWIADARAAFEHLRADFRARFQRDLPLEEMLFDRWERARSLGFGDKTSIHHNSYVYGDVKVGESTWIGPFTLLDGTGGLTIGSTCSISAGVQIYTHDTVKWAVSGGKAPYERAPVMIGDACYIGPNAVIVKGVTIGAHSVIGSCAFVDKDLPPFSFAFGVPCRQRGRVVVEADGDVRLELDPRIASMIVIVDYGIGNLGSILNMLKHIGVDAKISNQSAEIASGDKLILPGVGAFDPAMQRLNESGLKGVLEEQVLGKKVPTLGVCLGMQLLTEGSEEGTLPGLGWIAGTTKKFRFDDPANAALKIPHMGWNTILPVPGQAEPKSLVRGLDDASQRTRFYFVHSYHVVLRDIADAAALTHYGDDFVSMVQKDHIMATQFHPEKSHKFGMKLLRNFAELP